MGEREEKGEDLRGEKALNGSQQRKGGKNLRGEGGRGQLQRDANKQACNVGGLSRRR